MKRLLSFSFLLISSIISAQKPAEPVVAIRVADSKFQFVNKQTGVPVNQLLWDETDPFINGYSRVFRNNKFSFVSKTGKLINPVEFQDARNFSNKLAAVKKDGKWGFINESGKIIFPFHYDIIFDFEGSVSVAYENKKWWLINNNGETVKPLDISVCYGFKNGVAKVKNGKTEGLLYPDGKIIFSQAKPIAVELIPYHPNSNNLAVACPENIGFENGDFTNWQCYLGTVDSIGNTNVITVSPSAPTPNRHTIYPRSMPSAVDPFGLFPTNPPDGSNFAVRLGNTNVGAEAERTTYTIHVPLNDSNFAIRYNYAVVLQDPGHTMWTQPRFNAKLLDSATNTYIDCASFEYISTSGLPGFAVSPVDPSVIYKDWSSVFYSLRGYAGKTMYLEFTTADCVRRAHWGYAYVDVESICGSPVEMQYDCTAPNITTLTGPPGFEFYNWWDSGYTTLLGTTQQITLNPGPAINSIIWLEMIPFNNFGCKDTLLVQITGDFDAHFNMSAATGCAPQTFTFYNTNLPSTSTVWDFGDGTTAVGDTVTHIFSTPGSYNVTMNVTVLGGCSGSALHLITIYPTPNVVQPPGQVLCNGSTTNAINFTGSVPSTIFNWTNDNPSIGLLSTGTGNINAFTAMNSGTTPITATITITPVHLTCSGTPETFTITVNPTPHIVQTADQTLCNGSTTNAVAFSSSVIGASITWTNNDPSIGLAASGNGNIASFTATNSTNAPITATITVTASAFGCSGTEMFTITVNPIPNVVQPANQTLCNATTTNAINFTGAVTGTAFNWTNNNTSIGLPASGNGNIASFTATNTTNAPITSTITVTPSASGCPGSPKTFTITVNPTPNVLQPANQILCNGSTTNAINFTGALSGTIFSWANNNNSIGLVAGGTGNIPAFTAINTSNAPVTATITIIPSLAGCTGTPEIFTITVNPTPNVAQPANQILCNGATSNAISFSGSVSGTSFSWTNNNTSIGLAASGNGNIASFTASNATNIPVTATITVTPSAVGCAGPPETFSITVNPTADVVRPPDQTLCNGSATNAITFTGSVSGTTFSWTNNNTSIGLAASGNSNIASFPAINTGNAPVTATITVTPSVAGCVGTPETFTIIVNPTANVLQPANQILCNASTSNAIAFTGSVSGTAFSWTNNNTSIGLAASGNGDIQSFTAINTGNTPVTATITVTPSAFGCTGTPETFTITVNPTPDVVRPPDQALCNGATTNAILFTGGVPGTIYNWSNTAVSINLPATGSGNIPSFIAQSNGAYASVATITVTPMAFGCPGPYKTFTISVSPIPSMAQPPNQILCNGDVTSLVTFSGTLNSVTTYNWSNNNPSIGIPATGSGNISVFTAINTTNSPITATITVTPTTSSCPGPAKTFTITINPTPSVVAGNDMNVCLGSTAQLSVTGASQYYWTPVNMLSCSNCPNPVATPVDSIRYVVRGVSSLGCTNYDTVFLNVIKPFRMLITPNDTLCIGESTNLLASGANTYLWSPPAGLDHTDIPNPKATPTATTTYQVVGYDGHNCFTDTNIVIITVGPRPTLNIGPDLTLTTGSVIHFNPVFQNGPIINWSWTPATGLSCTNCPTPTVTVKDNSYYALSITNNFGCVTTDTVRLFVFCKSAQVFIPNAFTPDGDGLNDILMVRGAGIIVKTFRIFNRWGELVFEKTNFNPNDPKYGWDGKVRGVPATPDVFVYTADVICDNGVLYTYKGNTTLLK